MTLRFVERHSMSEALCRLCNHMLTWDSDATTEGLWAVTVEDTASPHVAGAHAVHTSCMEKKYAELVELARQELAEMGSRG